MRFGAKDSAIREEIAPLRANLIARITSDFKMDFNQVCNHTRDKQIGLPLLFVFRCSLFSLCTD